MGDNNISEKRKSIKLIEEILKNNIYQENDFENLASSCLGDNRD